MKGLGQNSVVSETRPIGRGGVWDGIVVAGDGHSTYLGRYSDRLPMLGSRHVCTKVRPCNYYFNDEITTQR